jgi:hypothetical protein
MGTRSAIGMRTPDGRITAIYCHWDGYPSHNGAILNEFYTDSNKIAELISGGDLSSLGATIGEKHDFNESYDAKTLAETRCTFYGRDRGETGTEPRVFNDAQDFVKNFNAGEEYYYLWTGAEWIVNAYGRTTSNDFPQFDRVEDVLMEMDE